MVANLAQSRRSGHLASIGLLFAMVLAAFAGCDNGLDKPNAPGLASIKAALQPPNGDETSCSDGIDNGPDGDLDCSDRDCADFPLDPACATCVDEDHDGYPVFAPGCSALYDCSPIDPMVHPGAAELCNRVDDDCDGLTDEGVTITYYRDADNDGYGNPSVTSQACSCPAGYVADATDCDDTNAGVHPGAAELCNRVDDDCDGLTDEGVTITYYRDADNDGYGNPAVTSQACSCPAGYVADATDCDDTNAGVHPGAAELCNRVDDDCDAGTADGSGEAWLGDACDGADSDQCEEGVYACAGGAQACTDNTGDSVEVCDGIDNDCNGASDEGFDDLDGDDIGDDCDDDIDGDGLLNDEEELLELDPRSPDSDLDTIADGEEVGNPAMPSDVDGDGIIDALDDDSDGDGILDIEEAGDDDLSTSAVDTDLDSAPDFRDDDSDNDAADDDLDNCRVLPNPGQEDTDGDGLGDLCDDDIDGDGLANDEEDQLDLDPENPDTDADGISDGEEQDHDTPPIDTDGDGTIDALDDDADGDSSSDADEAGDESLETPATDSDGDGTPDFRDDDSDGDTVPDSTDNCRVVANPDQEDIDQNGEGDACDGDVDGDGVENGEDNCPMIANPDQADQDGDGFGDACSPPLPESGCDCRVAGGAPLGWLPLALWLLALSIRRRRQPKR